MTSRLSQYHSQGVSASMTSTEIVTAEFQLGLKQKDVARKSLDDLPVYLQAAEHFEKAGKLSLKDARCPFRKFLASFLVLSLIRPGRIEVAFKLLGPWTKPCAPLPLLTAGLTERSAPHQRCSGVSPTVRMSMAAIIVFDVPEQSRLEICHRSEIASLQEPPSQHAEP
jgi:hypothetical protein